MMRLLIALGTIGVGVIFVGCPQTESGAEASAVIGERSDAELLAVLKTQIDDPIAVAYFESLDKQFASAAPKAPVVASDLGEFEEMFGPKLGAGGKSALDELRERYPK